MCARKSGEKIGFLSEDNINIHPFGRSRFAMTMMSGAPAFTVHLMGIKITLKHGTASTAVWVDPMKRGNWCQMQPTRFASGFSCRFGVLQDGLSATTGLR